MAINKILTLHPGGKSGRNIDVKTYELFERAIIRILKGRQLTHTELFEALHKELDDKFDGNVGWYGETVKLDMEARKIIQRTSDKPQKYKLS